MSDSPGLITPKLPTLDDLKRFADEAGIEPDKGQLFLSLLDCAMHRAPGLVVSTPDYPEIKPYYTRNYFPAKDREYTSAEGQAGFFNLPPAEIRFKVSFYEDDNGPIIQRTFDIQANVLTYLILSPSE